MSNIRQELLSDILATLCGPYGVHVSELGRALERMCLKAAKATACQEDGTTEAWGELAGAASQFKALARKHSAKVG